MASTVWVLALAVLSLAIVLTIVIFLAAPRGPTGPRGATGAAASGPTGPRGLSFVGPTGMRGSTGVKGAPGPSGATGAGEIGPTGAPGTQGPTGQFGSTGATGPASVGPTGPQGVGSIGPTGAAGSDLMGPMINVATLATSSADGAYFFAAGDGGWSAAFGAAEARGIQQIYFPQGHYIMTTPASIDLSAYPILSRNGLTVWGDGVGSTIFWHPPGDPAHTGNLINIGSNAGVAVAAYVFRDFAVSAHCSGYGLAFNDPTVFVSTLDFNGSEVANMWVNNDCVDRNGLNARGALFCRNWFASKISTLYANVHSNDLADYNNIGGLVLSQCQYCVIHATGLGANKCDDPNQGNGCYLGWGLILDDHCAQNTFLVVHVEIAGGGIFFRSSYSNTFNSIIFTRVLNKQPGGSEVPNDVVAWSSETGTIPSGHTYGTIFLNTFNGQFPNHFPLLGQSTCTYGCVDNHSPVCAPGFPT